MPASESLSRKVIKGGLWIFSLRITNRGLGFIRTLILARLLTPSDFGLIGIAMLAMSAVEMLSETGFQTALIQKKGNIREFLDTAWTVAAIRAVILFGFLFFTSPFIANFFNSPQTSLIIKVIAISTLLSGFGNVSILYFQKELQFHKQFIYEVTANIVDLIISIYLAFLLKSVWALVWGGLAGHIIRFVISYAIYPYRPRIRIEKEKLHELFMFGRWIFGSSIVIFLVTQGDSIFLGKMLGITALGFYQMAFTLSNMPTGEISQVVSQVTFPTYSKLQDDVKKINQIFFNVLQLNTFIITPITIGMIYLAPELIRLFLGEKWLPMLGAMQVLAVAGFVRSIAIASGSLLLATNKPDLTTKLQVLRLIILGISIYPLTIKWGILGTSYAILLSITIVTGGFLYKALSLIDGNIRIVFKILMCPLVSAAIMVTFLWIMKTNMGLMNISQFILFIVLGATSYLLSMHWFDRYLNYGMYRLIHERFSSL